MKTIKEILWSMGILDWKWNKIIGSILLFPPLFSSFIFLFAPNYLNKFANTAWTGKYAYAYESGGGGYMSALPVYFGLMAIAGAILISKNSKNEN